RWVVWRLEDVDDNESGKKRLGCKVPKCSSNPTRMASSTNPDTWSSLEDAVKAVDRVTLFSAYENTPNAKGVGLIISTPYFAVDLDKCVDEKGEPDSWAQLMFAQLPATYTERSPSKKGFHLWYKSPDHSRLPDGLRTDKMEVYKCKRYFTMT